MAFGGGYSTLQFQWNFQWISYNICILVSTPECAIKNKITTCAVEAPTETKNERQNEAIPPRGEI